METNDVSEPNTHTIQARFVSDTGEEAGAPLDLPISIDTNQLELICNALLQNVSVKKLLTFKHLRVNVFNFRKNKHLIYFLLTMKK